MTRARWDMLLSELVGGSDDPDAGRLSNEIEREVRELAVHLDKTVAVAADAVAQANEMKAHVADLLEVLKHVDYLLNELADERTPANVEMTPAEAALVGFRKHTRAAIAKAEGRDE